MSRNHERKPPNPADLTLVMDAGRDYFKQNPNALLVSAAIRASAQYASKDDQMAFLEGYQQARLQHEAYLAE